MGSSFHFCEVECKTIDGITLRGWFYEAPGPSPAIIMSHGFNCVKAMTLPELAERFQAGGYNVLLYDARSVGSSDGIPRNQIDPLQMAEDLSDIVTYVASLPTVNAKQIILWGMSFGATVSACAAAVDRRVRAVVMLCPALSFVRPDRRARAFAQLMRDRQSQLRGNEPFSVAPFDSKGENLIGWGGAGGPGAFEVLDLMRAAEERGHADFRDRITLQTYHKLALFHPIPIFETIESTPIFMVIPELDKNSSPELQKEVFERLPGPKEQYFAQGMGHLTIITDKGYSDIHVSTESFIQRVLADTVV